MGRILNRALLAAGIAAAVAASPAMADSFTLHGSRLVMTVAGNNDATIETDTSLQGDVRVSGDNASCLENHGGGDAIVIDDTSCNEDLDHLTIAVPANFPVILSMRGAGNVTIGDLNAQLVANVLGSGDLHVGRVAELVLNVSGSGDASVQAAAGPADINITGNGDVKIPELNGVLHVRQSGAGDLAIGTINSPAADLTLQASGDTAIGRGSIGALRARISSSGDLVVAATAATADLSATGGGDIRVAEVTGPVQRHTGGGSSISTSASGLERFGVGKIANMVSLSDDNGDIQSSGSHHRRRSDSGFKHVLAGMFVLFVLFLVWRMARRRGGLAAVGNTLRGGPSQPTHPGVIAVRDALARLEPRLARVEGFVTEREFELNRKFRDLERPQQ